MGSQQAQGTLSCCHVHYIGEELGAGGRISPGASTTTSRCFVAYLGLGLVEIGYTPRFTYLHLDLI